MVVYSYLVVYIPNVCSPSMMSQISYPVYNMHETQLLLAASVSVVVRRYHSSAVARAAA